MATGSKIRAAARHAKPSDSPYEAWFLNEPSLSYRKGKQQDPEVEKDRAFIAIGEFSRQLQPAINAIDLSVDEASVTGGSGINQNTKTVARMMNAVGSTDHQDLTMEPLSFRFMPLTIFGTKSDNSFVEFPQKKNDGLAAIIQSLENLKFRNTISESYFSLDRANSATRLERLINEKPIRRLNRRELIEQGDSLKLRRGPNGEGGMQGPQGSKSTPVPIQKPPTLKLQYSHPIPAERINADYERNPTASELRTLTHLKDADKIVVVGVIDDGLPFAHRNFLETKDEKNKKTRIDFLWLQGANSGNPVHQSELPIADDNVAFGKELVGRAIDQLRGNHGGDEDAIYADPTSGATMFDNPDVARNIFNGYTHGAHVLDLAAGFSPEDENHPECDQIRIVGVQLPRTALDDTSGFGKDAFILAGVHYILDRAHRIASEFPEKEVHALINVSLGTTGGPKNGLSDIELAIDEAVDAFRGERLKDIRVFFPTGNNYDSRMSAEATLIGDKNGCSLEWSLQPNDRTESIVEVWVDNVGCESLPPKEVLEQLEFSLQNPDGSKKFQFSLSKASSSPSITLIADVKDANKTIGQLSFDRVAGKYRLMVILAPTEFDMPDLVTGEQLPLASAGKWKLFFAPTEAGLKKLGVSRLVLHALIQRDEDPAGTDNGGRQSYFTHPEYKKHDEHGRRIADEEHKPGPSAFAISGYRTINGWATRATLAAANRLAVAGFTAKKNHKGDIEIAEPATYSATGERESTTRSSVDYSARSNRSHVLPGVTGAGTRSGSTKILIGTSAAAPILLRDWALKFLRGKKPAPRGKKRERLGIATTKRR